MRSLLFILLLSAFSPRFIFGDDTFIKTFGGTDNEELYSGSLVPERGYIFWGYTKSFSTTMDGYIILLSEEGDLLAEKAIDLGGEELFKNGVGTPDGGFMAVGYIRKTGSDPLDVLVVKLDGKLEVQWSKILGGEQDDYGFSIQEAPDGNYIISGGTHSFGHGDEDVYLIKINGNGDTLWTATYGDTQEDEGRTCALDDKGNIYITAKTMFGFTPDMYMIKVDSIGSEVWLKTFSTMGWTEGYDVCMADTVIAYTGYGYWGGNYSHDMLLITMNAKGDTIFTNHFGGSDDDYAFSISPVHDGGYILAGKSLSFNLGQFDAILGRVDAKGQLTWLYGFGGEDEDIFWDVFETDDHHFLACGLTKTNTTGGADAYIVKTDSLGIVTGMEQKHSPEPNNYMLGQNYPNPFNPETVIPFTLKQTQSVTIEIYNNKGEKVKGWSDLTLEPGHHTVKWDGQDAKSRPVSSGVYFYRLLVQGKPMSVKKMILLR